MNEWMECSLSFVVFNIAEEKGNIQNNYSVQHAIIEFFLYLCFWYIDKGETDSDWNHPKGFFGRISLKIGLNNGHSFGNRDGVDPGILVG